MYKKSAEEDMESSPPTSLDGGSAAEGMESSPAIAYRYDGLTYRHCQRDWGIVRLHKHGYVFVKN